jgi:hypothetical protein
MDDLTFRLIGGIAALAVVSFFCFLVVMLFNRQFNSMILMLGLGLSLIIIASCGIVFFVRFFMSK